MKLSLISPLRLYIWPKLETKNFVRYGIGDEISITILAFNLDYFQEKLMAKFFKK